MTDLTFHPLAEVFPLLEGEEFDDLVADIQASGLYEPVWLYEDQILDGRNRYRACEVMGLECATQLYAGDDPVGFVISKNLRRRHLDESQRAMVGARLATLPRGANQHTEISVPTQHEAATLLHVSADSIQTARKVQQEGAQEIIDAVDAGKIAVSAAVHLTALPREDQLPALQEAQHEATGNKPTAQQIHAVVKRRQEGATATADHDGHTKGAGAARTALPKRLSRLCDLVEALATFPDLEQLLLDMPPDYYDRLDQYLDTAFATLDRLRTLWKARPHAATAGPGRTKKSQQGKQPKKGRTQRETQHTAEVYIRRALRRGALPLTFTELYDRLHMPRAELRSGLQSLIQQGEIQEIKAGRLVVFTKAPKKASGSDMSQEALGRTIEMPTPL